MRLSRSRTFLSTALFVLALVPGVMAQSLQVVRLDGTSTTLTAAQMADLAAGKWYFNVHTAAHMSGEIRGQLAAVK